MGDSDDPPPGAALPSSPPPPPSPPTTATASGSQEPTCSPTVSKNTKKSGENSPKDQPKPNEKQGTDKNSKESTEKKFWADPDDESEDAAAALKQFLITDYPRFGDKSVFTEAYKSAAETLYSTIVWGKNNWVNIGSRCAHFGVLQRMYAGASNMTPAVFLAWMKERGMELPHNDISDPSRHYNAWLRKNHPTRVPTLADPDTAKAAVSQTQPPPKSSKGKERAVPETAPDTAPATQGHATTSSTTDQSTTNQTIVRTTDDTSQQGVAVKRPNLREIRNSFGIRKRRWEESNYQIRFANPMKAPLRTLRECQSHINQCLRIGRERRGNNWYLVIYEAPKDDPTSGIRLPHFVGHVNAYSEGYFALRAYKTALNHGARHQVGDYFKMYFDHQKNSIRDALMALDQGILKANQANVAGAAARQEMIERITNDVFQARQTTNNLIGGQVPHGLMMRPGAGGGAARPQPGDNPPRKRARHQ
ncbi:hypothetical protein COL154_004895 [Colletotrichum chrysophilum]|uniref:uncharacterized protein n=1 Tax=Colletotrichum chrysophilum TaxID=1836956 RepID=UPI002300C6D7|nr:uncharacterized protein COL26b_004173 [Colletotrichum chrysophilum]KAJ0350619.1 hypothetical protein KNSL1_003776 [Colletotrichum chrysophilum]KAJ0364516.1 hypothetical protein COL154_004895 [Colletotrichum chrysophilum]KAJ0377467.1 hypothetical protein COL26b_004173 [Colletotrichum chrysophilum]